MLQFENAYFVDLDKGPVVDQLRKPMHYGDDKANRIGVTVTKNGQAVTLSGECTGKAVLGDDTWVMITNGVVDGNEAYIELPSACYSIEGPIRIFLNISSGDTEITLLDLTGYVKATQTDSAIDPDHPTFSVSTLEYIITTGAQDQINAIEEAGAAQMDAIEDKGEEVIASIPSDYTSIVQEAEDTLDQAEALIDAVDDIVLVQSTEPVEEHNKIWVDSDDTGSVQVPTIAELNEVAEDVSDLKSAIDDISVPVRVSENFLPPDEEIGTYQTSGDNAGAKSDASYMVRTPDAIKVPDGISVIYIRAKNTFSNYLTVLQYATADTDSYIKLSSYNNTDRATITLDSNTKYIRLTISNNYSISDFSINTADVAYNDYEAQSYIKKSALPAIDDSDLPENVIKSQAITSANYFNNADIVANEWIKFNGAVSEDTGYYHSNIIVLPAGSYLTKAFKSTYGASAVYVHLYNADGEWTGKATGTYLVEDGNDSLMTFTLAQESNVKINLASSGIDTDMIVAGSTAAEWPESYIPYKNVIAVESGVHLNQAMEDDVNALLGAGILYGKKLAADGDSICYGVGYTGGYAKIIGEDNNMTVQNLGIGGGTIATGTTAGSADRHWICTSIENLDTDADYILLEGGVNDSSLQVPLGTNTASYDAEFDTTTFYGALNYMFRVLITRFAGKKYGFIIPHQMSGGMMPGGDYYNAIFEVAKKWGVPVLNLAIEAPPFGRFASTSPLYALTQEYTHNGDGWHPNEQGYKKYYVPKIEAWLKML